MNSVGHIHDHRLMNDQILQDVHAVKLLKQGIWLYFILLIVEGALRKWLLPGLSTPLLVVRDPIALLLVLSAWYRGMLPVTIYLQGVVIIGVLGLLTAIVLGHQNLWVAIFGARVMLLHIPLIFVMGRTFTREDVVRIGQVTLWMAIPMAILTSLQFFSPQSAWVNRGVGGSLEGAGFSGAMGYFRPPGTFSFTTGNTLFFGFVSAFVCYFWLESKRVNLILLTAATISLIIAVPFSISRGLFFQVLVCLLFMAIASFRNPRFPTRLFLAAAGMVVMGVVLRETQFFSTAVDAFNTRFESANNVEGGIDGVLVDRYLGGLWSALTRSASTDLPFFGLGLGLGTNAGSMLMTGEVAYLIEEGEWGRVIGELGPLMGLAFIFLRIGLCAKISFAAYDKLAFGDPLPWMLLSFGLLVVPQGQLGQPTTLGFCTVIGGLMLASLRVLRKD